MTSFLHDWYPGDGFLSLLATVTVGVFFVSAGAWAASRQFSRKPAIRHLILMAALIGCLGLPIFAAVFAAFGVTTVSIPLLPRNARAGGPARCYRRGPGEFGAFAFARQASVGTDN